MIRAVNGLLVVGVAIMAIACGIIEEADPTPPTETLAGAPEWAIQENLIASSQVRRETVLDLGNQGTIEIIQWEFINGKTLLHFRSTGGAESLMNHVLIRDRNSVVHPILPIVFRGTPLVPQSTLIFAPEVGVMLLSLDGVMEIYR